MNNLQNSRIDYEELEVRVLDVLRRIDSGELSMTYHGEENSHCHYSTPDGWTFVVYDDAAEWDYFDSITSPEGDVVKFDEIVEHMPRVRYYEPPDPKIWSF
jgi:hypothetical protein